MKQSEKQSEAYENGYAMGQYRREEPTYDARFAFADATREGVFAEFKRGFEDGFNGREFTSTLVDES